MEFWVKNEISNFVVVNPGIHVYENCHVSISRIYFTILLLFVMTFSFLVVFHRTECSWRDIVMRDYY